MSCYSQQLKAVLRRRVEPGQFTSDDFTGLLKQHDIAISMDGKGCWRDNVFVERLWRSVKIRRGLPPRLRLRLARAGIAVAVL